MILNKEKLRPIVLKNRKRRQRMKEKRKRARMSSNGSSTNENQAEDSSSQVDITNPFSESNLSENETTQSRQCDTETGLTNKSLTGKPEAKSVTTAQNCHRAGVDAFMTAFSFAVFSAQLDKTKQDVMLLARNKLYLSGKDLPLQITKGNFGKCSVNHIKAKSSRLCNGDHT